MLQVVVNRVREPFSQDVGTTQVQPGVTLQELAGNAPVLCRLNGGPNYVSRKDWDYRTLPGDVVELIEYPMQSGEGGGLQAGFISGIAAIASGPVGFLLFFAAGLADFFAFDPNAANKKSDAPTYGGGLQGNAARMYQPIPKMCGRVRHFPPYACEPYRETDEDGDEYFFAIMAVTIDRLEVERTQIDDTDIAHFADVLTTRYLEPGEAPTRVAPNVINSVEVSGQEMLTAQIVGGISACPPLNTVNKIGLDVVMPFGMGATDDDGSIDAIEVRWTVQIATLNQFGSRISPWTTLAEESRTGATKEVRRWTNTYDIDPPRRIEVRVIRRDEKYDYANYLNDLNWAALRGFINEPVELHPDVTHLEIVMRSSRQLSGVSQGRIAVTGTGLVRELLPDGTFGDEYPSRNPLDWQADLWLSTTWGQGLSPEQVDIATLVQKKAQAAERQDRFDFIFESTMDVDDAANLIAGSYRAKAFKRSGGVRTVWRDELVTIGRTAFTTRNTVPGSMAETESLPRERMPDGVIVEYFDSRGWSFGRPIECPCPGVTTMQDPVRVRLQGITGRTHATREGLFQAAMIAYRRRTVACTTEMQGTLPAFGSALKWQSEHTRWQTGDVAEWDDATLTARLTEPVQWGGGSKVIVFVTDDGTLTTPVAVTPGAASTQVQLAADPGFAPVWDDDTRERTVYMLGTVGVDDLIVKTMAVEDGSLEEGAQLYDIAAFVDDARIHAVDNALLPSPGEIQDPIDLTPGDTGGGGGTGEPVVNIRPFIHEQPAPGSYVLSFNQDGTITDNFSAPAAFANQWIYGSPRELSDAAQFQVFFELISSFDKGDPGTIAGLEHMGSWLPIDQDFVFSVTNGGGSVVLLEFNILIRDVATLSEQGRAYFFMSIAEFSGGGG